MCLYCKKYVYLTRGDITSIACIAKSGFKVHWPLKHVAQWQPRGDGVFQIFDW